NQLINNSGCCPEYQWEQRAQDNGGAWYPDGDGGAGILPGFQKVEPGPPTQSPNLAIFDDYPINGWRVPIRISKFSLKFESRLVCLQGSMKGDVLGRLDWEFSYKPPVGGRAKPGTKKRGEEIKYSVTAVAF
ncbi:MAG: hypothetical protein AAGA25_03290, partial [Planctomycetota bacterium]